MVCHPDLHPACAWTRVALDTPQSEGKGRTPTPSTGRVRAVGLGLSAAEVGVCGCGEGSLQVGELLPGAQVPGRHPSNVAAGQEGNGHQRKRSIW